jgi:hypothetical protein
MTYQELIEQSKKILAANEPQGEYQAKSFACGSGGKPTNKLSLPTLHELETFAYNTTANGRAYKGELVIRCRELDARDSKNRKIYEHENGTLFVYSYYGGSPSDFDAGAIIAPLMPQ